MKRRGILLVSLIVLLAAILVLGVFRASINGLSVYDGDDLAFRGIAGDGIWNNFKDFFGFGGEQQEGQVALSSPTGCTIFVDKNIVPSTCTTYNEATRSCTGGTERAYKTLTGAANVAVAGDIVCARSGIYTESLAPVNSGTPSQKITFKAYPGEGCQGDSSAQAKQSKTDCQIIIDGQSLDYAVNLYQRKYIRIEGFDIRNALEHIVYLQSNDDNTAEGIEIVNNYIHDGRRGGNAQNSQSAGIRASGTLKKVILENNEIKRVYNAIRIGKGNNVILRGNHIDEIDCDAVGHGISYNMTIENNYIHGPTFNTNNLPDPCHQDGLDLYPQKHLQGNINLTIRNNLIFGYTQLIYISPCCDGDEASGTDFSGIEIYGNILYNAIYTGEPPGIFLDFSWDRASNPIINFNVRDIEIHSNTCGDLGTYPCIRIVKKAGRIVDNIKIRNNIMYDNHGIDIDTGITNVNSDYNLFYPTKYSNVGAGNEVNSIVANPLFVDYISGDVLGDFNLQQNSPAIDVGVNIQNVMGLTNMKDFDGNSRPIDIAGKGDGVADYDIGAYEYGTAAPCTTHAQCSNGNFCDGAETCNTGTGQCVSGTAPCIADAYSCTTTCNEASDTCNAADDTVCNDNNACTTNDRCVGAGGAAGSGCLTNNAASGTSCTVAGGECASNAQCNGAGACVATGDIDLCSNPDGCNRVECSASYQCVYDQCPIPETLELHYKFDDVTSDGILDSSPNVRHGSCGANCPALTADRNGNTNAAYSFDGTNDRVEYTTAFNAGSSFSVSGWINPATSTNGKWHNIFADSTGSAWAGTDFGALYLHNGKLDYWYDDDTLVGDVGSIPLNAWSFITLTAGNGNVKIYVNGVMVGSGNANPVFNNQFYIGRKDGGGDDLFFNGTMDDVRVYSKTLTQQEVTDLFSDTGEEPTCESGADANSDGTVSQTELNDYAPQFYNGQITITQFSNAIIEHLSGCNN